MTRKNRRASLKESLSEVVRPPEPSPKLDEILGRYATSTPILQTPSRPTLSQPAVSEPNAGQPIEPTGGSPLSQPATGQPTVSLLDTAPDSAGFSKIPNRYYDHLCAHLSPDEQAVYSQLYRLSHGYGKETCLVSLSRLSERSSVPLSTLKRVMVRLVGRGLVEKVNAVHGPQREQGVTYRVPAASQLTVSQPRTSQPTAGHNKRTLKEKDSKSVDANACPDCHGTGWRHREDDRSKPVERCHHPKLTR